ncbi:hypothetical protein CYMTET_7315 [Cymbomonas tetramitiformis]|uniref:Reverse transcriptase n=1 Tax=Cymbomonas tetramitiformis TaxID=36881 RepID=A0AAE0LH70_9CHLO|nr:hypothetical protein CYMTET_7315 [Cymbomonas tetramitiformis]
MMARREQSTEDSAGTAADLPGGTDAGSETVIAATEQGAGDPAAASPGTADAADVGAAPDSPQDTKDAEAPLCWKQRFAAIFDEFEEELRESLPPQDKLRQTKEDKARVNLKPDKEGSPPFRRPYRMSVEKLRQLWERIEQLRKKGYIRPSSIPYDTPCLMVPCQAGSAAVPANAESSVLCSRRAIMIQVPMAEEDVEKTAFATQMGSYEWLVMS